MKTVIKYLIITGVFYLALSCTTPPSGGIKAENSQTGGVTTEVIPTGGSQANTKPPVATVQAQSRLALVIGNASYQNESKLYNTVNDANDMAEVLKTLGFEVLLKPNLGKRDMVTAVREFGEKLPKYDVGLFYYSGHGLQVDGINYLVPVDAQINNKAEVEFEAVDANRILTYMEQANNGVNIVILDACRNNPFQTNLKGIQKGLAEMKGPTGSLIAFATAPNKTARGGEIQERYSVYTKYLLQALRARAQVSVLDLLTEVAGEVYTETHGQQVPWKADSLREKFYFAQSSPPTVPPIVSASPTTVLTPLPPPPISRVPSREVWSWKAHSYAICVGDCLAFTPDGQVLASGSWDDTIKLWQVSTGQLLNTLTERGNVQSVAVSPDGQLLASGSDDSTAKLWQINTRQLFKTLLGHENQVLSVAFSPDGKLLASGSTDQIVRLWQVNTGQLFKILSGHQAHVMSVTFSPDGQLLVSGSSDKTIKLWQVSTGQLLKTLTGHEDDVNSVAISPDGQWLASGSDDKTIKLWQVSTGQLLKTLTGHEGYVWSVAISPDGQWLVSGSRDHTVKLWQVSTGRLLKTLTGHKREVASVAISPFDGRLASGDYDGVIKLWE